MSTSPKWLIANLSTGHIFGAYAGATAAEAIGEEAELSAELLPEVGSVHMRRLLSEAQAADDLAQVILCQIALGEWDGEDELAAAPDVASALEARYGGGGTNMRRLEASVGDVLALAQPERRAMAWAKCCAAVHAG